jgi:hypothetical protein
VTTPIEDDDAEPPTPADLSLRTNRALVPLILAVTLVALVLIRWLVWRASTDRGATPPLVAESSTTAPASTAPDTSIEEPPTTTAPAAGALAVTPPSHNHGVIRKGTRATRQFELTNGTSDPLSIQVATSTCRLYYEHAPVIPPNAEETSPSPSTAPKPKPSRSARPCASRKRAIPQSPRASRSAPRFSDGQRCSAPGRRRRRQAIAPGFQPGGIVRRTNGAHVTGDSPGHSLDVAQHLSSAPCHLWGEIQQFSSTSQQFFSAPQHFLTATKHFSSAPQQILSATQQIVSATQQILTAPQHFLTAGRQFSSATQHFLPALQHYLASPVCTSTVKKTAKYAPLA